MTSEWRKELNGWLQEHMLATSAVISIISGFMFENKYGAKIFFKNTKSKFSDLKKPIVLKDSW